MNRRSGESTLAQAITLQAPAVRTPIAFERDEGQLSGAALGWHD
jgi:hypothetical protein